MVRVKIITAGLRQRGGKESACNGSDDKEW